MDERDAAAAPPSVQPAADPTQTNVEAQIASREQVTGAMSGLAPGLGSGPSAEEPPPSAQPPTAARAQAQASNPATRSITTAPVPGRAPATATAPRSAPAPVAAPSHGHGHGHEQPALRVPRFVAPSSYLRFKTSHGSAMAAAASEPTSNPSTLSPPSPLDKEQRQGLKAIRDFLKVRTSYDVLPLSFRLIVLDTDLLIKKTLNILIQNTIVSAPLWDSQRGRFAGILTATDYINVIQYYCQFPDEMSKLDQFRLSSLRGETILHQETVGKAVGPAVCMLRQVGLDIEKAIGATPIETVSVHPSRPLYEACRRMLKTRARRIPLVDIDDETGRETVISVITQYRILKFIAVNNEHNTVMLKKTVREIGLGTYSNLATMHMDNTVLDAIHLMVDRNISCIPIVDSENRVLNAFEAVDVIPCIRGGAYEELDGSIGEALCKRPEDSPGIYTCGEGDRLDSLFDTIRKSRVHRLIVIDDDNKLKGVISLSDILKYVLIQGEEDSPQS